MKKTIMIVLIGLFLLIGVCVYASFDSIAEGDKKLYKWDSSQSQAYYLRDIAESLRIISGRTQGELKI